MRWPAPRLPRIFSTKRGDLYHQMTLLSPFALLRPFSAPSTTSFLKTSPPGQCAAGATALLCAQVDTDTIQLIGRWRSDGMLRYLHVQAKPVMRHFAQQMLTHGAFTMHPSHDDPMN
jgi:hypothetical protein